MGNMVVITFASQQEGPVFNSTIRLRSFWVEFKKNFCYYWGPQSTEAPAWPHLSTRLSPSQIDGSHLIPDAIPPLPWTHLSHHLHTLPCSCFLYPSHHPLIITYLYATFDFLLQYRSSFLSTLSYAFSRYSNKQWNSFWPSLYLFNTLKANIYSALSLHEVIMLFTDCHLSS